MTELGHPDLNRVAAGTDSFLGRVLVIGRDHDRLPPGFEDGLMAFLRIHATSHARKHRTGIAVDRETLDAGVRQGFTCVEAALEGENGDVEAAIERLAGGDLEALRRQGWERIWHSLDDMRQEAAALLRSRWLPLLEPWRIELDRWATLVPETWTATDDEGDTVRVDPLEEHSRFGYVSDRARLFDSLPDEALRGLLKRWSDTADFPLFLRQLIAALALGKLRLPLSKGEVEAFVDTGFDDEGMVSSQREAVIQQVETHLRQSLFAVDRGRPSLPPPDDVVGIGQELRQEIVRLSGADPQTRLRLLQLPKPTGVR